MVMGEEPFGRTVGSQLRLMPVRQGCEIKTVREIDVIYASRVLRHVTALTLCDF